MRTGNVMIGAVKQKKEDTLESLTQKFLKEFDRQAKEGRRERQVNAAQGKLIKFIVKNKLMSGNEMINYFGRLTVNRGTTDFTIK